MLFIIIGIQEKNNIIQFFAFINTFYILLSLLEYENFQFDIIISLFDYFWVTYIYIYIVPKKKRKKKSFYIEKLDFKYKWEVMIKEYHKMYITLYLIYIGFLFCLFSFFWFLFCVVSKLSHKLMKIDIYLCYDPLKWGGGGVEKKKIIHIIAIYINSRNLKELLLSSRQTAH